jgi:hypothetical protein
VAEHLAVSALLLVPALLLGAVTLDGIRLRAFAFETAALVVVLGLFGWAWLAFLLALVLPLDVAVPLAVALPVVAGAWRWRARFGGWRPVRPWWPPTRPLPGGRRAWALWGAVTATTVAVLAPLFWTHDLPAGDDGIWSAGSTWADFGLHAAIVSHVAEASRLPMDLPVAAGARMTYPFLIDLLSGLWLRAGVDLHAALFVPGLLLALGLCQLLLGFALRLFGSLVAASAGLGLFLLTGTAAGLPLAYRDWRASGRGLLEFVGDLPRDYTTLSDVGGNVTNVVAHALLPQRGMLFGLGVGLAALVLFHEARTDGSRRHLLAGAVLVGLLPMAHPHSFLAVGTVLAALAVEAAVRTRRVPWAWLGAGVLALALALPQLVWQQVANGGGTGGRIRLGWMVGTGQPVLPYWWANFGLMGVLFLAIPFLLSSRDRRQHLVWYVPALVILAVTQVYAFQPFEYDNLKLIYWVYLLAALFGAHLAVRAVSARRSALALVVPVALVIALPGMLSLTHEFGLRDQFASPADVALAAWVRHETPPDAVFLTTDRPNQPIATLGGRSIVYGYAGWLYNFSLPGDSRRAAVTAALAGRVDDPAVRAFGPGYLAVATNEDPSYAVNRPALAALPVAYANPEWTVYRLGPQSGGVAPAG